MALIVQYQRHFARPNCPKPSELVNDKLTPLQEKIESMITHADSVLITVNNVFNTDAQLEIQTSIANLNTTISNFRLISETIDKSLAEDGALNQTIDNLIELTDDLSAVSSTLKDANLGVTFDDLGSAVSNLSQILDRIERGEGSLGRLVTKDDLYQSLSKRISRSNCF